jgi:hypothetical protein
MREILLHAEAARTAFAEATASSPTGLRQRLRRSAEAFAKAEALRAKAKGLRYTVVVQGPLVQTSWRRVVVSSCRPKADRHGARVSEAP